MKISRGLPNIQDRDHRAFLLLLLNTINAQAAQIQALLNSTSVLKVSVKTNQQAIAEILEPELPPPAEDDVIDIQATSGSSLAAYMAVFVDSDGLTYLADSSTDSVDMTLGVTIAAINASSRGDVRAFGPIENTAWAFVEGPVYLGTAGALTQTPPSSGAVKEIGFALSPTSLFVSVQQPARLAAGSARAYFDLVAGRWQQKQAITVRTGTSDADKLVATRSDGHLDETLMLPSSLNTLERDIHIPASWNLLYSSAAGLSGDFEITGDGYLIGVS